MLRLQIQPASSWAKLNTSGFQPTIGNVLHEMNAHVISSKTLLLHEGKQDKGLS
jgi:hypothetical protein